MLSDPTASIAGETTPWDSKSLPGLCLLNPEMEIVDCSAGHGKAVKMLDDIPQ